MAKIIITNFHGFNPHFENLKPNTIHEVVDVLHQSIWVRGVDVDVRLYYDEYKWIDQDVLTLPNGFTYQFQPDALALSSESCKKCALVNLCGACFFFPCWYKARKDGKNGYFTLVDSEMTAKRPA